MATNTTNTIYHHTDHLTGSSIETDSSGSVLQVQDYLPFGSQRINSQSGEYDNKKKFAGKDYDPETELTYFGARYYDPEIGRFFGWDPIQMDVKMMVEKNELNGYRYAKNNPLKWVDIIGLASALVVYGQGFPEGRGDYGETNDTWKQKAEARVRELQDIDNKRIQNGQDPLYSDGIYAVDGSTFENWNTALTTYKDISVIEYYGHADGDALYIREVSTADGYRYESLYKDDTDKILEAYSDGTSDHYISSLSRGNTTNNLQIHLWACNTTYGVAQSFANHFGSPVLGSYALVNFEGHKPYVKWFRQFPFFDGGFKWIFPGSNNQKRYDPSNNYEKQFQRSY